MNIFVLDENPIIAAKYHNDNHVVKMILESTQLLMSAYHLTENEEALADNRMYKLTHKNHPCTKWVNESMDNWNWLYMLLLALHSEWKKRYDHDKHSQHKSFYKMRAIVKKYGRPDLPLTGMTDFVLAMPDNCKLGDPVLSYRKYYKEKKGHLGRWRNGMPEWYNE